MRISFRHKLIFSYVFVIVLSFGLIALFLNKHLEENSLLAIRSSLITQAQLIEGRIAGGSIAQEDSASLGALAKNLSLKTKSRITIIALNGKVLADSEKSPQEIVSLENHRSRPEVREALGGDIGIDTRYSPTLKIDMLYVAVPVVDKDKTAAILRLALPLESVQKTLSATRRIVFLGLFFALGLAFILGSLMAGRTIEPINKMILVSRKFSEGDFSRRILQIPHDEIGELAATLNAMAQGLEDKIKEIRAQNQKLAAIFNSMIEGVLVIDKAGRIVSVNPTVEKIFGIVKDEAEGRIFLESIRNNDIAEVINAVLGKGAPVSREIALIFPVHRIFELSATPIFDNEAISGCLVVIHDLTEIRRLETVRRDFIANASHELKTPLTSIKGFVETLLEGALEDKENNLKFLKIIQEHSERLNNLVDDLLSLSHLESKEITLHKKTFNVRQQAEDIIAGFKSHVKKMNIEIRNELLCGISVNADQDRVRQVFINLIDNAIKFNKEKGSIRIYAQEADGAIKIFVEDTGIGIPEKDIPRIFERFYRVDKARSRELGGTGLGLSIIKHIVELHGGEVGVESTEGLGSTFWFILPK